MGFQIPLSPNQDQFYKEKLPNSIPFHSMKRTLPKCIFFLPFELSRDSRNVFKDKGG
ncbi:hypothetical protein Hanom_Chr14g01297561 [Helianthus anomalus]